jgi:hypothetical protein
VRLIDLDRGASYALDIELVNHDAEPQAQPSPRVFGIRAGDRATPPANCRVVANLVTEPRCWNLADKMDSKSIVRKGVWVRIPPGAHTTRGTPDHAASIGRSEITAYGYAISRLRG